MYIDLTEFCVGPEWSITRALAQMNLSRMGIVLVVDSSNRLLGTVTDGDMRRAVPSSGRV